MSCNGCRVLRKGCSDTCILRPCLQWIESPESQGHATIFVAKFYGRACLMSFISNVPESQRPGLFESLLFEAAGRTVNPVNGAVGLLWTGNWDLCQAAVETVLRGGALRPISPKLEDDMLMLRKRRSSDRNRRRNKQMGEYGDNDDFSLVAKRMREETPSEDKSDTTTCFGDHYFFSKYYNNNNNNNNNATLGGGEPKLLNLF